MSYESKLPEIPEFADARGLKDVVAALGEQGPLAQLLAPAAIGTGVRVVVGREARVLSSGRISVVSAVYGDPQNPAESIGFSGATRRDDPGVVPLVVATAEALSTLLARPEGKAPTSKDDD